MVEHYASLDMTFAALADSTRRDIIRRIAKKPLSISNIAKSYSLTFAAISKHVMVLEKAGLIKKHRQGKQQMVELAPQKLQKANECLQTYQSLWEEQFDLLELYLKSIKK